MQKRNQDKMITVIKANGEIEPFNEDKIRQSLLRSGAKPDAIDHVINNVRNKLYQNISTKKLYKIVYSELRKLNRPSAGKYHLKRAIMELGPTGFPFEKYVAEIFKAEGYQTQTGEIIMGKCVKHEVDVIAENEKEQFMMECKFHTSAGTVCNIKHALYVSARFQDIDRKINAGAAKGSKPFKGWLVTNTRMTSDAEQYGLCFGLGLLSWSFPKGNSLRERIDKTGLHPITCITSLTRTEKKKLLEEMVVLCKDLSVHPELLKKIGVTKLRRQKILSESRAICMSDILL